MTSKRIAVIPGDGIGREVVPEGLRVVQAAASRFGIALAFDHFDWSCDYYLKHGRMMPEDWKQQISSHYAIFFGADGGANNHNAAWATAAVGNAGHTVDLQHRNDRLTVEKGEEFFRLAGHSAAPKCCWYGFQPI